MPPHQNSNGSFTPFYALLGELVIQWNYTESLAGFLLSGLAGGGDKTRILTSGLGNVALKEALLTFSNEFAESELRAHINHFCDYFDRMREHRNWLVHSIAVLGNDKDGGTIGLSQSTKAKGRLVFHQKQTREADLTECIRRLLELHDYGNRLVPHVYTFDKPLPLYQPLSSLEMPLLPDRLQKSPLFLRDVASRPPSSP